MSAGPRGVARPVAELRGHPVVVGVLDSKVDETQLPAKFDGLCGGGLWFGWESGRFALRGIMDGHALATTLPPGSVLRPRSRLETARCRPRDGPRYDHE